MDPYLIDPVEERAERVTLYPFSTTTISSASPIQLRPNCSAEPLQHPDDWFSTPDELLPHTRLRPEPLKHDTYFGHTNGKRLVEKL